MPGILPMKVIKVGTNAQTTRIAQACDRCRSKKIRCDGIRPSCTQCVNVGFECKTSDKLSRRAFPRGYTESLEERVRSLESEVRELKALLDEKDEKIDMLSRIHAHSPQPSQRRKSAATIPTPESTRDSPEAKDDVLKIEQPPPLAADDNPAACFMGTSSSRLMIEAFKSRLQEFGKPSAEFSVGAFFDSPSKASRSTARQQSVSFQAPARMVSDQLVNIFFQEWAPLYPILHRPTFLKLYEEYVSSPDSVTDKQHLAQLNLVFAIAAQSSDVPFHQEIPSFTAQWQAAVESFVMENDLTTLQCLLLAQIASLQSGDYSGMLKYKALASGLSQRLGLHLSQKRFALGTLTVEMRKKLFWTMYTLDCFTSAQLGLPRSMRDEDVQCEDPVDADDEYITEDGFLPTLPGEFTKLSSALALMKVSRILAKAISTLYPAKDSYAISFRSIVALSDELDEWLKSLPQHLRLQFVQDKPSTNIISSRSPLLSLAYHYIRSLIYRPAVCASEAANHISSSAKVALASCSKHTVQIIQLLSERNLSFSFCLNKNELLVSAGFGLLFQSLGLERGSTLLKENQRLTAVIAHLLDRRPSKASVEFRRVSTALTMQHMPGSAEQKRTPVLSRHNSDSNLPQAQDSMSSAQKHFRAIVSRFSSSTKNVRPDDRRATLPVVSLPAGNISRTSLSSIRSEPHQARSEPSMSPDFQQPSMSPPKQPSRPNSSVPKLPTNLDFLPLGSTSVTAAYPASTSTPGKQDVNPADWERLLSSLDSGKMNIYDGIYGGPAIEALADVSVLPPAEANLVWSPDVWAINNTSTVPQSVLSFSDESLTSGEEFPDLTNCASNDSYNGILIPEMSPSSVDSFGLPGLDGNFGL
ncbi:uncharacterized protein PV09_05217 [Verruconis gallopava]|uniref:Zn(2)-C6 fungal-type domain-containing protein n=1 Tax=Verruconis gallopava TaxID=253628 RepID=A0A0D1YS47_9PEZI|nr:uncharacterized protein PV09_05217 [Verruconis gallopava]KIW03447.1 hypothetical protein PV09_05217 [Verruconis gallopava]